VTRRLLEKKRGIKIKKIKILLLAMIALSIFAACSLDGKDVSIEDMPEVNGEEVKVEEIDEVNGEQNTSDIIEDIDESQNLETTEVEVATPENWSCVASVRENEDLTLTVDYLIVSEEGTITLSYSETPQFDKSWYEMYRDNGGELYAFEDYNFDGYLDLRTQQYGAMVNQYYNIRIWNNSLGEFELNEAYMGLSNPTINEEKKQIFTTNYDRGLGNYSLYEVKDGLLTKIATIEVTLKDDGSILYTETIGDQEGKTISDTSELNEIWEGYDIEIL
jgi:hypothetical protein